MRPKTHCEQRRDSAQTTSPEGYPILGVFVPQCDANGQYSPQQVSLWPFHKLVFAVHASFYTCPPLLFAFLLQCHGSSGHCWCVDSTGQERPETRTLPGTTPRDCDKPGEACFNDTQASFRLCFIWIQTITVVYGVSFSTTWLKHCKESKAVFFNIVKD